VERERVEGAVRIQETVTRAQAAREAAEARAELEARTRVATAEQVVGEVQGVLSREREEVSHLRGN
jgi:hypothetical protein